MQDTRGLWIAWGSGTADTTTVNLHDKIKVPQDNPSYTLKRVFLTKQEIQDYYKGYANRVLWPLCHYFIEKMSGHDDYWKAYVTVNKKFADAVLDEYTKGDKVWIHDYHFALAPEMIKKEHPDIPIAFFWHIPFPPWEVFSALPQQDSLLTGLLNSDLIGFHTQSYVRNFICTAQQRFSHVSKIRRTTITHDTHTTHIHDFPLGISYNDYANTPDHTPDRSQKIKTQLHADTLILGIDRLDYTKGILNRIKAFEYFITQYPYYRGRAVLVQIATPSRDGIEEYKTMKRDIDETAGRLNANLRTETWAPLVYFYRKIPQDLLLAYYKAADIALLTPLRDGMNLIAKEFIATNQKNGVLILSKFAGASERLTDALQVNPYDTKATGEAIKIAIDMTPQEKTRRFNHLKKLIRTQDAHWWLTNFLTRWETCYD
jgi:trehalose 6-phosphate synthase/phosphatase